jgi:hypothetical protein
VRLQERFKSFKRLFFYMKKVSVLFVFGNVLGIFALYGILSAAACWIFSARACEIFTFGSFIYLPVPGSSIGFLSYGAAWLLALLVIDVLFVYSLWKRQGIKHS